MRTISKSSPKCSWNNVAPIGSGQCSVQKKVITGGKNLFGVVNTFVLGQFCSDYYFFKTFLIN